MHKLWDDDLIKSASPSEIRWLRDLRTLDTEKAREDAAKGSVEEWATESLLATREAYQNPQTGQRIKPGAKLGDAYQEKSLPVVRHRLYQAGVRLAKVLNECFE
jgi:hypothetical protein